ncbi:MAG TPA: heme o synthase [Woeseiaceae bacterium]|nr:heme o synthase [Woeseiaceae bacterium]
MGTRPVGARTARDANATERSIAHNPRSHVAISYLNGRDDSVAETAKLLYSVLKLRIGFAITLSALAGLAMTPGPKPGYWQMLAFAMSVLIASGAAGAFNHYVERGLDARMARTRRRPFVTGRFRSGGIWPAAIGSLLFIAVAVAAVVANAIAALYVFLGAFVYGVVYTLWLKRRTWLNIVIGGLAGSFAVLAGAAAVDPGLAPTPLILAIVLFLWTPPHFWSLAIVYRSDYAAAGVPMLPVVAGASRAARAVLAHTLLLVALSLVPVFLGMGLTYGIGAAGGGAFFIRASVRLARRPSRDAAMANFRASLVQLSVLLTAALLDRLLAGGS